MGGANAVISAIITARDFATPTIQRVAQASSRATMNQIQNMTQLDRTIAAANKRYDEHLDRQRQYEQNTHRMGMTTGRLITMMVKFGIILKALQLVTSPLKLIGEGIRDLITTDRGVREITGMLREQGDTSAVLVKRYADLTVASRNLQRQFGFTAKDSVSGLYDIASVIQTLNITGFATDNTEAIIKLAGAAGHLAIAGFMPLEEATSGLTTVFNALNIPLTNVNEVMDIMFNAVKIGKGHMSDLTSNMGSFLEILGDLTTQDSRLQSFQETMGIFGYLTTVVSAPRAGTAVKRLLEGVAGRSPEQQNLITGIQSAFGVDLSAARFSGEGPKSYFGALIGAVGPDSPQLSNMLESRLGYAPSEAQMRAVSTAILEKFTGDKRAATALLSMRPDQMESVFSVMAQRGSAAAAEQESMQAYETRWNIFQQRISVIAQTLQQNTLPKMMSFFDGISSVLDSTMSGQNFANMGSGQQLKTIITDLNDAFQNWFIGGPRQQREGGTGREAIRDTMRDWGTNAAQFFMGAFGIALPGEVEKNRNYFYDAANTMIQSLTGGIFDTIGSTIKNRGIFPMLGDIWGNPLGRGAGTFFGLMKMGVPWFLALPLALAGGATASTDLGGIQGPAAVISAVATAGLIRRGITGAKNMAMKEIVGPITTIPGARRAGQGMAQGYDYMMNSYAGPLYSAWSPSWMRNTRYPNFVPGQNIPGMGYMPPPMNASGKQLRNYGYSQSEINAMTAARGAGGTFTPGFIGPPGPPNGSSRMSRFGRSMRGMMTGESGMSQAGSMIGGGIGALAGSMAANRFAPDNEIAGALIPVIGGAVGMTGVGMVAIAGGLVGTALWETAQTIGVVTDNWDKVGIGLKNWWEEHFPGIKTPGSMADISTNIPGFNRPLTSADFTMGATIPGMQLRPGAPNPYDGIFDSPKAPPHINLEFHVDHMNMDKSQLGEFANMAYEVFVTKFGGEADNNANVLVGPMITP